MNKFMKAFWRIESSLNKTNSKLEKAIGFVGYHIRCLLTGKEQEK